MTTDETDNAIRALNTALEYAGKHGLNRCDAYQRTLIESATAALKTMKESVLVPCIRCSELGRAAVYECQHDQKKCKFIKFYCRSDKLPDDVDHIIPPEIIDSGKAWFKCPYRSNE